MIGRNLLWGGVLLLHPFIVRLSSAPLGTAPQRAFSYILSGGSFMRLGKDSFFLFAVAILGIFCKNLNTLPMFEKMAIFSFLSLGFLTQSDFLNPVAFYQSIFLCVGLGYYSTLYRSLDTGLVFLFECCFRFLTYIGCFWIFLEWLNVKPYQFYAELFIENFKYSSTHGAGYMAGILNHPNMSGAHLALCIPFFLERNKFFIPVILLAIYALDSALPLVTAFAVIFYYCYSEIFKVSLWPFLAVLLLGIIAYFTGLNGLDNERFLIWSEYFKRFSINPFWGNGLGFFGDHFHSLFPKLSNLGKARHEHSEWVAQLSTFGMFGIFLMATIIKRALRGASPVWACGLFGVFVNCYGNHLFHLTTLTALGLFYFAVCLAESEGVFIDSEI